MKKITIGIPIIGYIIMMSVIIACGKKKAVEEPKDDFLKVPSYTTTPSTPAPQIVYVDRATKEIVTDSTYWFVILDEQKKDGGTMSWHKVIALPTPYFDFYLARKAFKSAEGNSFFEFIFKVNREARDSYWRYAADPTL
jgi:hypothetical protein